MATTVGRNIRRLPKRSGYSQARLAALARTSQSWISRLETADENPTIGSVTRIAQALRVEVMDLLQDATEGAA